MSLLDKDINRPMQPEEDVPPAFKKQVINAMLVKQQCIDRFRENLKMCIYDGAALMSVDELAGVVREVSTDVLGFLSSPAKGVRRDETQECSQS